ncbi:MAG: IPTL-CTERM sorting domain-containing protein, partial [Burkholderiaceae bacterium]|nr:IPTL-CTERM sorting domain-containing protein [Burkholderiaceae bacterium]
RSFVVGAATGQTQTISFGTLASRAVNSGNFTVSATTSSGLAAVFSSLTASICTVAGNTVTLLAVGTCTIAADQAGNASYAAAPQVAQSFSVTAASGGGGGDADIPTLPEWGAVLLGLLLLTLGMRHRSAG